MLHLNENKFISAVIQTLILSVVSYSIANSPPIIYQESSHVLLVA